MTTPKHSDEPSKLLTDTETAEAILEITGGFYDGIELEEIVKIIKEQKQASEQLVFDQANEAHSKELKRLEEVHKAEMIAHADMESQKYLESVLRVRAKYTPNMTVKELYDGEFNQKHDLRGAEQRERNKL